MKESFLFASNTKSDHFGSLSSAESDRFAPFSSGIGLPMRCPKPLMTIAPTNSRFQPLQCSALPLNRDIRTDSFAEFLSMLPTFWAHNLLDCERNWKVWEESRREEVLFIIVVSCVTKIEVQNVQVLKSPKMS